MRFTPLLITPAILCLVLLATPVAGNNSEYSDWRDEATALYENDDFGKAYKAYLKLGKKGDVFSAYRVSYMMLKGQGTRENLIEAFAWAVVAAESGSSELTEYRDAVGALIPVEDRKKAQQKVDYFLRRYGPDDNKPASKEREGCTGSRLSCNNSPGSPQKWITWRQDVPETQEVMDQIETLNNSIAENNEILDSVPSGS
jgi:hypothetical protein